MQHYQGNLFTRDDTFFGVCQGLGEDTGIPPNLLRIAFALGLFFSPAAVISVYLGLGVLVLATRLLAPDPRRRSARASATIAEQAPPAEAASTAEEQLPELAQAA
jgi:phage shock protein PspC (stress-responsive transcriptional regulator)